MSNDNDNEIDDVKLETHQLKGMNFSAKGKKSSVPLQQTLEKSNDCKRARKCQNGKNETLSTKRHICSKRKSILSSWRKRKKSTINSKRIKASAVKGKGNSTSKLAPSSPPEIGYVHDACLSDLSSSKEDDPKKTWTRILSSSTQVTNRMDDYHNSMVKSKSNCFNIEENDEYFNKIYHPTTLQPISYVLNTDNKITSDNQIRMITKNQDILKKEVKEHYSTVKVQAQRVNSYEEDTLFRKSSNGNPCDAKSVSHQKFRPQEVNNTLSFASILDEDSSSSSSSLNSFDSYSTDDDELSRLDANKAQTEKNFERKDGVFTVSPRDDNLFASITHPPPPPPRNCLNQSPKKIAVKKKKQNFKHVSFCSTPLNNRNHHPPLPMTSISFLKKRKTSIQPRNTFNTSSHPSSLCKNMLTNIENNGDNFSSLSCKEDENKENNPMNHSLSSSFTLQYAPLNPFKSTTPTDHNLKMNDTKENINLTSPTESCSSCEDEYKSFFSDTQSGCRNTKNGIISHCNDEESSCDSTSSSESSESLSYSSRSSFSSNSSYRARGRKRQRLGGQDCINDVTQIAKRQWADRLKTAADFASQFKSRINDCFLTFETTASPSQKKRKLLNISPPTAVFDNRVTHDEYSIRVESSPPLKNLEYHNSRDSDNEIEVYNDIC